MTTNLRAYMARQAAKYRAMTKYHYMCTECGEDELLVVMPENAIYTCETCRYKEAYNV